ncbi:MAG TPA: hypothetical protein VHX12_14560 [Acidisoma sp.]|jgi:hypothetical protein|nr:hypothetical protein [Acidisoma sp.]
MKHALVAGLALIFGLAGSGSAHAQPPTTSTPVTRILAIGTINPGVDQAKVFAILPNEARDTVNLYLDGKIEQFWFREDAGPIFLMNAESVEQAKATLDALPLVGEGLMTYELLPVTTLRPLGLLIEDK